MAMVLSAFAGLFINRLAALAEEELVRLLGVQDDLLQLLKTVESIKTYLADAELKKITEKSISLWLANLRDLMYDADDLFDDCHADAEKNRKTPRAISPSQTQSASSSLHSSSPFKKRYPCGLSFLSFFRSVPFRQEGWTMLCKLVFRDDEEEQMKKYEKIGMKIVQKCRCIPLAIKAIAEILIKKDRTMKAWIMNCSSESCELSGLLKDIVPGLLLSYDDLPFHLMLSISRRFHIPQT